MFLSNFRGQDRLFLAEHDQHMLEALRCTVDNYRRICIPKITQIASAPLKRDGEYLVAEGDGMVTMFSRGKERWGEIEGTAEVDLLAAVKFSMASRLVKGRES